MASGLERRNGWQGSGLRKALWGGAALLLLCPALAMGFTAEVNWTASDFLIAALLLFGAAGLADLAMRTSADPCRRAAAVIGIGTAVLTIWVNAAVGMIGPEDSTYNRWFLAPPVLAMLGAAVARFRAEGMAVAAVLAGAVQLGAGLGGAAQDPHGAAFASGFAGLWLLAAALFARARRNA
jgi:hypothetical protein